MALAVASRVFELERAQITLVPARTLTELLPGEIPTALPAFIAYAVGAAAIFRQAALSPTYLAYRGA